MALKPITDFASQILKPYINNQDKAYAANIAPVETNPATSAHTAGTQIIYNGVLYDVTADIAANDALATTGAGANIAAADDVSEQISNVKQALSDEVTTRATLGAHNLGKRYRDGVSFASLTIKDAPDGGCYVNGTASQSGGRTTLKSDHFVLKAGTYTVVGETTDHTKYSNVILQKASDNTAIAAYKIENGAVDKSQADITLNADTECYFGFNTSSGVAYGTDTFIVYPMVRLADDKDDTFYPYAKPNTELTKDDNGLTENEFVNGAVNLLQNTASSAVIGDTTFTVNDNGTVKVVKTTTGTTIDQLFMNMSFPLKKGRYKLSGIPPTGTSGSQTYIRVTNAAFTVAFCSINSQNQTAEFSLDADTNCRIFLSIDSGYTTGSSGVEFRPMITVADVPNSDYAHYVPYAMTNKELTDEVSPLLNLLPGDATSAPNLDNLSDTGFFSVNNATNKPSDTSSRGVVINIKASNASTYLVQLYLALYSTNATKLFVRNKYESTWNSWTQIQ